jgi:hypothetical protein
VRRELDEQMERLTKLLERVESIEFGRDTSETIPEVGGAGTPEMNDPVDRAMNETNDSEINDPTPAVPPRLPQIFRALEEETEHSLDHVTPLPGDPGDSIVANEEPLAAQPSSCSMPNLASAVVDLTTQIVSDFVFDASSADSPGNGPVAHSISIHTDEVPTLPVLGGFPPFHQHSESMLTVFRPNRTNPSELSDRARRTKKSAISAPAHAVRMRSLKQHRTRRDISTVAFHAAEPRGVVQDFTCPNVPISDDSPSPQIFQAESGAESVAFSSPEVELSTPRTQERSGPDLPRSGQNDLRPHEPEPLAAPEGHTVHTADSQISDLPISRVPLRDLPPLIMAAQHDLEMDTNSDVGVAEPQIAMVAPQADDGHQVDRDLQPGAAAADGEEFMLVENPHPGGANTIADGPMICPPEPDIAHTEIPRDGHEFEISDGLLPHTSFDETPSGTATFAFRQPGYLRSRSVLGSTSLASIPTASSQLLNVLAVLGAILTIATLALVATDFASWF